MAHSSDWYATVAVGIAGGTLPPDTGPRAPDGLNLWPALTGVNRTSPRVEVVHAVQNAHFNGTGGHCPGCQQNYKEAAARFGRFKIVTNTKSCASRAVAWPELGGSPVPFGRSSGTRAGPNGGWAYAGLLPKIDKSTGYASGGVGGDVSGGGAEVGIGAGDPRCLTGINGTSSAYGPYCCLASCTRCGCPGGVPYGPGGKDGCCAKEIRTAGLPCSHSPPPCVEGPAPPPAPKTLLGCLFDVEADPAEQRNLRNDPAHAAVWAELEARLAARGATGPPLTSAYPLGEKNSTASKLICDIANKTGVRFPVDYFDGMVEEVAAQ
jgi:hypothetical protein